MTETIATLPIPPSASRRDALRLFAATPLAAAVSGSPLLAQPRADASLKSLAQARGLRFGAAVPVPALGDRAFVDLLLRECDVALAHNEMKWHVMEKGSRRTAFADTDRFVAFADAAGLRQRGHAVVWDREQYTPPWLRARKITPAIAEQAIIDRTQSVVGRYRGMVQSWDVINEGVNFATGGPAKGPLMAAMGWDYAALAFQVARDADPGAELVYNDYVQPFRPIHQEGVLRFLDEMARRNAPIDTVGIQGHVDVARGTDGLDRWPDFLRELRQRGLQIVITELDVTDDGPQDDPKARDLVQARAIGNFLDATLAEPAVKEVVVRGLTDKYEGLSYAKPRKDRIKRRPSPFDAANRPKPIRDAIADSFRRAPRR